MSTRWTSVIGPASEEVLARFREAWRESEFWQENYQHLAKEYPDQFLAARDGTIIAAAATVDELGSKVRALWFELPDVWTSYIPAKPMRLLL